MRVAPHDNDVDHRRLAAFLGHERFVQLLRVPAHEVDVQLLVLALPLLLEREEDGVAELVLLQLRLHALLQAVVVALVAEGVLDLDDVAAGAPHQALDEELPPRRVALVPEVRPVRFALPPAQRDRVRGLAEVARDFELDVFGDVDAFAADFDVFFVFGAELEDVIVAQLRQDPDDRTGVGSGVFESRC